ncbi:MAG: hypothetical protein ACXW31_13395 [Thermoanaerobaculia bacterium]
MRPPLIPLFPVGRIGNLPWAFVSCDLLLGAAFALIAWQVFARPELWSGETTAPAPGAELAIAATLPEGR